MSAIKMYLWKRQCKRMSLMSVCNLGPVTKQSLRESPDDDAAEASKTTLIFKSLSWRLTTAWCEMT
ncbi:hypothetical protein FWK35_00038755 [Aphis craccivora]|uniref:Uncharacterized protein n=1 Tax=Aphis craccivora TaxID=307492 RepID=A0A6G0VQI8_APHCR|nr:hypothetical protein FWK35_00038755 [Aphis craccivora]